jgi:hypothetical protein
MALRATLRYGVIFVLQMQWEMIFQFHRDSPVGRPWQGGFKLI